MLEQEEQISLLGTPLGKLKVIYCIERKLALRSATDTLHTETRYEPACCSCVVVLSRFSTYFLWYFLKFLHLPFANLMSSGRDDVSFRKDSLLIIIPARWASYSS